MKTKQKDEMYCGVNYSKIKEAKPILSKENFPLFLDFMRERFRVHVKKDILKEAPPWTENKILQEYKFTNVFREDDRVTRALLNEVSKNNSLTLEEKVVNSILFRAWNNPRTFKLLGGPFKADVMYDTEKLKKQARPIFKKISEAEPKYLWFSSAYNQGGTKVACQNENLDGTGEFEPDIPLRIFHICSWLKELDMYNRLMNAKNQKEAYEIISDVRGFARFLAYQIFVDLSYIEEFPFSENEFTIAGPGCRKGIDLVFEEKSGMTYEECLFWLRDHLKTQHYIELRRELKKQGKDINVMSLENCMCEISKYIRTYNGTGRPRCHYKPRKED